MHSRLRGAWISSNLNCTVVGKADFSRFYELLQEHRQQVAQRAENGSEEALDQLDQLDWLPEADEEGD